jgi:hypothetical protein
LTADYLVSRPPPIFLPQESQITTSYTKTANPRPIFPARPLDEAPALSQNFNLPGNHFLRPFVKNATRLHMKEAVGAAAYKPPPTTLPPGNYYQISSF